METEQTGGPDQAALIDIGERIAHLRAEAGLSQRALAQRVGCSNSAVAGIEVGRSGLSLLLAKRIAGALGVTLDDLAGGEQ